MSQPGTAAIKSASTSYLLSKISSLASLTIPNKASTQRNNNSDSHTKSAHSSPLQQQPHQPQNIITKIFNRKTSHQNLDPVLLSSSSSNSIDSPSTVVNNNDTIGSSSSPIHTAEHSATNKPKATSVKSLKKSSSKLAQANGSSSVSYSNLALGSRRPFKKRSQSIQTNVQGKLR